MKVFQAHIRSTKPPGEKKLKRKEIDTICKSNGAVSGDERDRRERRKERKKEQKVIGGKRIKQLGR